MESNGPPRNSTVSDVEALTRWPFFLPPRQPPIVAPPADRHGWLLWKDGHRSSHSVKSTHFHNRPSSFLKELGAGRSIQTTFCSLLGHGCVPGAGKELRERILRVRATAGQSPGRIG
jgi:hypothetical protein